MDEKELNKENIYNYSKDDGFQIKKTFNDSYKIQYLDTGICKNCGLESDKFSVYCTECGEELYSIRKDENFTKDKIELKNILKVSLASTIILFIVSVIYKIIIFKQAGELNEFVSPIHILLAMNLGKIDIFTTSMFSSGAASIKLGLVIFIILPIIVISICNIMFIKNNRNIKMILKDSLAIGIIYGCIIGILSIFSKNRINMNDMFMSSGALVYGFSLISSIVSGFVIAFISSLTVGIFTIRDKSINIELVKISYKTIGIGILLTTIILMILSYFNRSYIHDLGLYNYANKISMPAVIIQLGIYIWAFANLIPVTIGNISLSILGVANSNLFVDTKLVLVAIVFISALVFILVGNKLKCNYNEEDIKIVKQFSISYSLLMGILATISSIFVTGTGISSLTMGFGFVVAVLVSYIYSFIFVSVGYKLS